MSHPNHLEIALRLGAAILAGALIGLERQWNKHTAGVRTHALVALGAALFVLFAPLARTPQETSSILLTLSAAEYQSVQLEQITTRVGLEPGVSSVSWKRDPTSLGD